MSQAIISRPASVLSVASKVGHGLGVPNLPDIQHPLSRLGNPDKLNVRGLSSQQGARPGSYPVGEPQSSFAAPRISVSAGGVLSRGEAARRSLPRIPRPFSNIPEGVEVIEAEDQTKTRLPVFGSRADLGSRADNRAFSAVSRMSRPETKVRLEVDEIEIILREKIKKSYYELRKLFIANDPEGRGIVTPEALNRILITFAGQFIASKQFNALLARFRLNEHKVIKLEEFYACLRETITRTEMPAWMDPVNRGPGEKINMFASQVHVQLKEKARQRFLDVAEMIPQMNPGGTGRILKPEFRNALNKMLFFMDDDEFEKLWNKYDTDGLGVIKGERLMNKLGINLRSGTAAPEDGLYRPGAGSPELSPRMSPRRLRRLEVERTKSLDIERWLKDKFRQGFFTMRKDFEKFDTEKKGEVVLGKFTEVLERYDLKLDKQQLDAFLSRCNLTVHPKTRMVSYIEFLQRFQDRSDTGIPHKILLDPEHLYNRSIQAGTPGAASNVTAAEAKLMGLFQTDFLALLGTFHKIDKLRTNVISQQEFRAAIQSRCNIEMLDEEFAMFIDRVPLDDEGNVKYVDFMADFDTRGGVAPSLLDAKSVYNRASSPTDNGALGAMPRELRDSYGEPKDFEEFKKGRPLNDIAAMIKALLKGHFAEVEEAFRELDEQNSNHMSQDMMYRLFRKLRVKPEITRGEIRRLWDTFITSQHRTYNFLEFVRHFGYSMKSAAFPNAKVSPPKRGDSDFLIRSRKLNCAADMLEDNLRSKVDYMWDDLRREFLGLDVYGTGFVSKEEFRDVLQELCVHLNARELDVLSSRFEIKHDGRVSYIEFLKPFALRKQTHCFGNNMLSLLTHPQAEVPIALIVNDPVKGLSGITARLRQRLVGDWRTLRRAFKKLDHGYTGYLSLPEFRNVLRLCNMVLDEDEVYHVMSEFDEKMDGKINYNKFLTETFNADVKAP